MCANKSWKKTLSQRHIFSVLILTEWKKNSQTIFSFSQLGQNELMLHGLDWELGFSKRVGTSFCIETYICSLRLRWLQEGIALWSLTSQKCLLSFNQRETGVAEMFEESHILMLTSGATSPCPQLYPRTGGSCLRQLLNQKKARAKQMSPRKPCPGNKTECFILSSLSSTF